MSEIELRRSSLDLAIRLTKSDDLVVNIEVAKSIHKYLEGSPHKKRNPFGSPIYHAVMENSTIKHPVKGTIPFVLFPFQETVLGVVDTNKNIIINASRQMGFTTLLSKYAFWYALMNHNSSVLIFSPTRSQTEHIRDYVLLDANSCQDIIEHNNRNELRLINGSIIRYSSQLEVGCGRSFDLVIFDNAAFLPHKLSKELKVSLFHTVTDKLIIHSCPNVAEGFFWDIWNTTDPDWIKITMPYFMHPDRDLSWAKTWRTQIGDAAFEKEFECRFPI